MEGFVLPVLTLKMENAPWQLKHSVPKFSESILKFYTVEVSISSGQPRLPLFIRLLLEVNMEMKSNMH